MDEPIVEGDGRGGLWVRHRLGAILVGIVLAISVLSASFAGGLWAVYTIAEKANGRSMRALRAAEAKATVDPVKLTQSLTELNGSIKELTAVLGGIQRDNDRQDGEINRLRDKVGNREKILPAETTPHSHYLRMSTGWIVVGGGTHWPTGTIQRQPAAQS